MSRRARLLLLLALVLTAVALLPRLRRQPDQGPPPSSPILATTNKPDLRPAGRPAAEPDPVWIAAATEIMAAGPGRRASEHACGPYRLLTDAVFSRLEPLCGQTVSQVESTYANRLGIEPVGPPRAMILLFSERDDFRTYVAQQTGLPRGYAAFSRASRGIVAVVDVDSLDTLAATLIHEIAHLAHRRAFGPDLPRWLSEGLADAVGDTATTSGIAPLEGISGTEAATDRLLAAIEAGEQRPLVDLFALSRQQFDRELRSFDYEQSALLVRFLLLDAELGSRFRDLLRRLAAGTPYRTPDVAATLEIPVELLETRFESWLRASAEGP